MRLDIPVFTNETRSLKASLIRSVTGGSLRRQRGGAVVTALQDISCTIHEGDRIALIGHNGAGKSTFLRLISGIYQPTAGFFHAQASVFPMIHKSFITSDELSGLQAHYMLVHGNLRGLRIFWRMWWHCWFSDFIHLPVKPIARVCRLGFFLLSSPADATIVWLWMKDLERVIPVLRQSSRAYDPLP